MRMRVLLIYPECPSTFWSFSTVLKYVRKKSLYPPLGLLTVASLLPKDWEKKVIDENVSKISNDDILWADMVFISAMIVQKKAAQRIINKCKSLGRKVVCGGPAFTTGYKNFKNVDYFILNEAEITLPLFINDLKQNKARKVYTSTERPDIRSTPIPSWDLINFSDYSTMLVQYSRGCPFNCDFCDIIIMNGRVPRTKTPEQVIREFQILYDKGWRDGVFIVDDNFIGNKSNVKEMLPSIIEWQKNRNYPFKLLTEASTNLADDDELMQLMVNANFEKIFLGIETPDTESLKECGKFQNVKRNLVDTIKKIHRKGMQVMGGFIVGFDNDKENIFDRQIKLIQESGVVTAMVGVLTALPETKLWKRLKGEGRILKETSGGNTDGNINFIPIMGKEKLIKGYKKILSTIYSPKEYYKRIAKFIQDYNPVAKGRITWNNILALARSNWEIGVKSSSRFLYWKLLIKTFFTKIKAFPVAVELAIQGLHYQKITSKLVRD